MVSSEEREETKDCQPTAQDIQCACGKGQSIRYRCNYYFCPGREVQPMYGDCCAGQDHLHDHKNHFPAKPSDLDVYVTGLPLPDEVEQYSECSEDEQGLCRWEREDRDEHQFYQDMLDVELGLDHNVISCSYSQTKKLRMRLL